MKHYTETSIKKSGWYFVYPNFLVGGKPGFCFVDQDAISEGWLQCRRYAGEYIGPITPPKSRQVAKGGEG